MAKKKVVADYPFYGALRDFYLNRKGLIRRNYKDISRKFLDYNDSTKNPNAFLRRPQFEALEMYVFIKEFLGNAKMKDIFADWYNRKGKFDERGNYSFDGGLFDDMTRDTFVDVFDQLNNQDQNYPNYIYALTMGTGKTILMATCIFYEFLVASKFPKDERFIHNALVFAPDKTVLQSLKEIKTFDLSKVVPPEYTGFLYSNLKFHFMDESGMALTTTDGSDYNIIISNTQKIILKTVHKEKSATEKLFQQGELDLEWADDFEKDLYSNLELMRDEKEVTVNQRFEKIIRLNQLGIFVDEAHHLFGADLKKSLSDSSKETSLRFTINEIAKRLEMKSTRLVACFNFTGTPYVDNKILPEVVYTYGLKDAIRNAFLKEVEVQAFENVKNEQFLKDSITHFFNYYGDTLYEGLKPKMAIFGATVDEVVNEIKPAVEGVLNDLGIDLNTILVNVGESTITHDNDIYNFNNLDVPGTEGSKKQIILLVNKGREGWNCRSLFSVALFRSPKSKIFVLQSTMRCLRSITDIQQKAHVYLSYDNYEILNSELQKNFNVTIKDINGGNGTDNKKDYAVYIVPPVKTLSLPELKRTYTLIERGIPSYKFSINLEKIDPEKYKIKKYVKRGIDDRFGVSITEVESDANRPYSKYEINFEIARYLNIDPLQVSDILDKSGLADKIEEFVSKYNDVLYDEIIPAMFNYLYKIDETIETIEKQVPLIKYSSGRDHFVFRSTENMTIQKDDAIVGRLSKKSFHTDRYVFDSAPEKKLFMDLLSSDNVEEVYFTGMFTGSENGLTVQYIDPDSNVIRHYYPDILVFYKDGSVEIIEVKGDNAIDDKEVEAKAFAMLELAEKSGMTYDIVRSSDIMHNRYVVKKSAK